MNYNSLKSRMSQILSLIKNLDGKITKEIRPKIEKDVKWYIELLSCCARIDDFYSDLNIALDDIQTKYTSYGRATEINALLTSEKKVLDNLVKCLKFHQTQTGQSVDMIKSEITTGAVHDERCVYSFLCIADGLKNSLKLSRLIVLVNKHCEKLLPTLSELKECQSSKDK